MIIDTPRDCEILLYQTYKILKKNLILSNEKKKEIAFLFFEYCAKKLDLKNIEMNFISSLKYESGSTRNNKIAINENGIRFKSIIDLLNTVAHEIKHCKQNLQGNNKKKLNTWEKNIYPFKSCKGNVAYTYFNEINGFYYYLTSVREKDARDYANNVTASFFNDLKQFTNKNVFLSHKINKYLQKIQNYIKNENKTYGIAFNYVKNSYKMLPEIITKKIDQKIELYYLYYENNQFDKCNSASMILNQLITFYCNDEITDKIIDFSISTKNMETFYVCLNHPKINITNNRFNRIVDFLFNSNSVSEEEFLSKLENWDINEIKKLLEDRNIHKKTTKQQKFTNNYNYNKNSTKDCDDELTF